LKRLHATHATLTKFLLTPDYTDLIICIQILISGVYGNISMKFTTKVHQMVAGNLLLLPTLL